MTMVDADAYRRANGSSSLAWSKGWQPSGVVLLLSREPLILYNFVKITLA